MIAVLGLLKPQQRLWLLKSNSLHGLLHQLVLAKTTKRQLRSRDILVAETSTRLPSLVLSLRCQRWFGDSLHAVQLAGEDLPEACQPAV